MNEPKVSPKQHVTSIRLVEANKWDAAVIVDGFMDSVYSAAALGGVLTHAQTPLCLDEYPVGTRMVVRIEIVRPEDADAKD